MKHLTATLLLLLSAVTLCGQLSWWSTLGDSLRGKSYTITLDNNDTLYMAGELQLSSGMNKYVVQKWTGTDWEVLAADVNGVIIDISYTNSQGLIIAGNFNSIDGIMANRVARWDGAQWHPMGEGFDNFCFAVEEDQNGNVYAGGRFDYSGRTYLNGFARWADTAWVRDGPAINIDIRTMAINAQGHVYAGGGFGVKKWEGDEWETVGNTVGKHFEDLKIDSNGTLFGASEDPAFGLAEWTGTEWTPLLGNRYARISMIAVEENNDNPTRIFFAGDFAIELPGPPIRQIAMYEDGKLYGLGVGSTSWGELALDNAGTLYASGEVIGRGVDTLQPVIRTNLSSLSASPLNKDLSFSAFPNPSSGKLFISGLKPACKPRFSLITTVGKVIPVQAYAPNSLDLKGMEAGIYMLRVECEGGETGTQKVIPPSEIAGLCGIRLLLICRRNALRKMTNESC